MPRGEGGGCPEGPQGTVHPQALRQEGCCRVSSGRAWDVMIDGSEGEAWAQRPRRVPSSHLWAGARAPPSSSRGLVHHTEGFALRILRDSNPGPPPCVASSTCPGAMCRPWAELLEGGAGAGLGVGTPSVLGRGSL